MTILGIESSCDDTAAAVYADGQLLSNVIASQDVHAQYGGVVPELASRAHLSHFIPTVHAALSSANKQLADIDGIAVTNGPGLMGSLVVGVCGARGLAAALGVPLIGVNHMQAHIMSTFLVEDAPSFPFLCLTISGGHTQLTVVRSFDDMEIVGKTRDDAAGEAFDKIGKLLGLPYPAGPYMDRLAQEGEAKFSFSEATIPGYDFSFSGLKTQVLYFLRDRMKEDDQFIETNKADIAASVQQSIVGALMKKLIQAADDYSLSSIAVAGGVSANSEVRKQIAEAGQGRGWKVHIPSIAYCTDNAAMIAVTGYHSLQAGVTSDLSLTPYARQKI